MANLEIKPSQTVQQVEYIRDTIFWDSYNYTYIRGVICEVGILGNEAADVLAKNAAGGVP